MALPIPVDYEPMEAQLAKRIPAGEEWIYQPKWDGFRCLIFKDGQQIDLRSKAGKPLDRYFPDVVEIIRAAPAKQFVLDGELVVPVDGALVFDELLLRIHPAESRVQKLAAKHPAEVIAFDLLVDADGKSIVEQPLSERLSALEPFADRHLGHERLHLSPSATSIEKAERWLSGALGGLDGVVAKEAEAPYYSGERKGMKKIKRMRSAECVVGGFRWSKSGKTVGSLLLGLYGEDGKLHHVGFCSALKEKVRKEADEKLISLRGGEGFSGKAPGGPSRWRKEGSGEWERLEPEVVVDAVEVGLAVGLVVADGVVRGGEDELLDAGLDGRLDPVREREERVRGHHRSLRTLPLGVLLGLHRGEPNGVDPGDLAHADPHRLGAVAVPVTDDRGVERLDPGRRSEADGDVGDAAGVAVAQIPDQLLALEVPLHQERGDALVPGFGVDGGEDEELEIVVTDGTATIGDPGVNVIRTTAVIDVDANVGGAASAPVVAAHHRPALVPASILMALIGYAVGNYLAILTGRLAQLIGA